MNRSVPITANGIIPVSQSDVAGVIPIALSVPDLEGQAILRVFANSTRSEIGCYSAIITNGATFSQPVAVGTVLGLFTLVAVVASFATIAYGSHIPTVRTHYAHSLSIFVVFAVFHHIYYTGALSVNWPSVVVAWWSNFAWAGGMIYSESMQNSINQLIGSNKGNISMVGAAGSGPSSDSIGGGYQLSKIYKRTAVDIYKRWTDSPEDSRKILMQRSIEHAIAKRDQSSNSVASPWYGTPVKPGLPIPGNYSGFAGTLSQENIPASNAFMTGFLWFLILVVLMVFAVVALKWILEGLSKKNIVKTDRLGYFRVHWISYAVQTTTRIMFIGFFMMMFLTLFHFTFHGYGGATAIAALVFIVFFAAMSYLAGTTCYERLRYGHYEVRQNRLHFERRRMLGVVPVIGLGLESGRLEKSTSKPSLGSLPIKSVHYVRGDTQQVEVHQDEQFILQKGWLTARFRRTRWWFFAAWLFYEFIRACFYGGAAGHPMTQVFGLLVVECLALFAIIAAKPFEGARLNALVVYLLGFSKVATVALAAAFDPRFNLPRITTTVIGIVIIVIQGVLTIVLLIAIIVGAISSYMSLTRNHEDFKPRSWAGYRERYFAHIEMAAKDLPPTAPAPSTVTHETKKSGFDVKNVRRQTKIHEENDEDASSILDPAASRVSLVAPTTARTSRANSIALRDVSASNLPFGARNVHRASWSTRDMENFGGLEDVRNSYRNSAAASQSNSRHTSTYGIPHMRSDGSMRGQSQHPVSRAPLGEYSSLDVRKSRPNSAGGHHAFRTSRVSERQSEEDEDQIEEQQRPNS
ncbi:uncharacterized protein KY384_006394 [Bacidia gigantensis]|uniref:uncharacterized protein n=1 Tax=Bacidia gigantensis TaxID=2732470 RepID=UPI001D0496EB|nr:uncharacterized protein KY384_006394 [Bacidia gigantensis]KAG8528707.1 hypothetical protein KY384_006394 [Bacidia gigantensis]